MRSPRFAHWPAGPLLSHTNVLRRTRLPGQPNFLILMADQLAARALPAYGNRTAKTPHLDALAAAGVVFDSFYCNSPLCAPSRYSFLSGRQVSAIGAFDNAAEFPAQVPTFAHYLRRGGYQTVLSGKMHFCGADQLHGFEERLTTDIYPADFGWTPDWTRFAERPHWYHTMDSVTQAGPCTRTNQIDFDDEVIFSARQKTLRYGESQGSAALLPGGVHDHPHDPYSIPQRYWDRYAGAQIDMPRVSAAAVPLDPHSERLRHVCGLDLQPVDDRQTYAARRAYYGAVSYVDDQVGGDARDARGRGVRERYHRAGARRSCRHAGRAGPVVQNELLRRRMPHPIDRARSRSLRRAPDRTVGLARRHLAHAVRTRYRTGCFLRDRARWREPGAGAGRRLRQRRGHR